MFKPGNPGRPEGVKNRTTLIALEAARVARENPGEMPVDYMLRIMRDKDVDDDRRDDMAKAAAQYLHPRLAAIKVEDKQQVTVGWSPDQLYSKLMEIMVRSGAIKKELLTQKAMELLPSPEEKDPAGVEQDE